MWSRLKLLSRLIYLPGSQLTHILFSFLYFFLLLFPFLFWFLFSSFLSLRTFPEWSIRSQDAPKTRHHFINNYWSFCSPPFHSEWSFSPSTLKKKSLSRLDHPSVLGLSISYPLGTSILLCFKGFPISGHFPELASFLLPWNMGRSLKILQRFSPGFTASSVYFL